VERIVAERHIAADGGRLTTLLAGFTLLLAAFALA
jgi:hypothetical protein